MEHLVTGLALAVATQLAKRRADRRAAMWATTGFITRRSRVRIPPPLLSSYVRT